MTLLLSVLMILVFLVDTSLQELCASMADLGVTLEVAAVGICVVCPVLYLHIFRGPQSQSTPASQGCTSKTHQLATDCSSNKMTASEGQTCPKPQVTPASFERLEKPRDAGVAASATTRLPYRPAPVMRKTPAIPTLTQHKGDQQAQAQRSPATAPAPADATPQVSNAICLAKWNQAINAAAKAGCPDRAERLLSELGRAGLEPDSITFNSVVHACAKQGDIQR